MASNQIYGLRLGTCVKGRLWQGFVTSDSHKRWEVYCRYKRQSITIVCKWATSHWPSAAVARGGLRANPHEDTQAPTEVQGDKEHWEKRRHVSLSSLYVGAAHWQCLFAVAFVMAIFSSQAPDIFFFDVGRIRSHLSSCLTLMKPFLSKKRSIKNRDSERHGVASVYCNCRLLEYCRMFCCDTWNKWYHGSCVVPPQVYYLDSSILWTCNACTL